MCESIVSGTTGMLVEAEKPAERAQALVTVLENPMSARDMGREGRKRAVEHFSWEARAKRLMNVYRGVIAAT